MRNDIDVHWVSSLFNSHVKPRGIPLYEATERHGVLEWAARLKEPRDTYLTLSMWDVSPGVVGLQSSVAIVLAGEKYVRDFTEEVSIADESLDYEKPVEMLLLKALAAANADPARFAPYKIPDLYAFAAQGPRSMPVPEPTDAALRLPPQNQEATGRPQGSGKFEIIKDKDGRFRFRLKAGNGEIIAVSQAYETKAAAKNGIASVQENAADATVVDLLA